MQEMAHMEWVQDVELFVKKGYAVPEAYCMAQSLLGDILTAFQVAFCPPQTSKGHTTAQKMTGID